MAKQIATTLMSASEAARYFASRGHPHFVVTSATEFANARRRIYRAAYAGSLKPVRNAGRVLFLRSELDAALKRGAL